MKIFDLFNRKDINRGLKDWENDQGSILVDVRNIDEFKQGHIKGSINIPLNIIFKTIEKIDDKNRALYVYCRSGKRSAQAKIELEKLGYTNVKDIGGIIDYKGKIDS